MTAGGGEQATREREREKERKRERNRGTLCRHTRVLSRRIVPCRISSDHSPPVTPYDGPVAPFRDIFVPLVAQVCAGRGRRPPQHWPRLGAIRICFARGTFSSLTKLLHFTSSKLFSIPILLCPFSECVICTVNLGSLFF